MSLFGSGGTKKGDSKPTIDIEVQIRDKISSNVEVFCRMYEKKELEEVDDKMVVKRAYGMLDAQYRVHASQVNAKYPLCKFEKLKNVDQLGMQATKDALALYFSTSKQPEFMSLYVLISYAVGAELENEASLTPEVVLSLIILLIQLKTISPGLKKLIELVSKYVFTTFNIKVLLPFVPHFAPVPDDIDFV